MLETSWTFPDGLKLAKVPPIYKKLVRLRLSILVGYFYEQFVDKFDTPKISKLVKISNLKLMLRKLYLSLNT